MNGSPVLVIGYGNPARGDDGLAPAFVESLDRLQLPGVETRNQYQLCVEDAIDIAGFAQVIFVDASLDAAPPFEFSPLQEDAVRHLDTHTLSPGALMYLARTLFGATASTFVMAIRGYRFEAFTETITNEAQSNLQEAIGYFTNLRLFPCSSG